MKRFQNISANFIAGFSFAVLLLLVPMNIISQDHKAQEAQKVFSSFEDGLSSGAVDKFSNYFCEKNYLSLSNGITGYYSSNQSYYVLKDYLSIYKPISFKLINIVTDTSTPFASGVLRYSSNGIRGTASVFVSLQHIDSKWHISQITIN